MRRHSLRRAGGRSALVVVLGLGFGFLAGFVVRSLVGGIDRPRLRQVVGGLAGGTARGPTPRASARRIQTALDATPEFGDLGLEVMTVRPGYVELHGWVPTRAAGARALRVAAAAEPGTDVISRLRVRGEDDAPPGAAPGEEERRPA